MTVPIEQIRYVYAGPYDINDQIPIPFVYSEPAHVKLLVDNKPQTLNIDYSVLGQTLTMLRPVGIGSNIVILRETPLDQESSYPQEAEFDSAKIEGNLDKLTMQNQEQEDTLSRCLKVSPDTPEDIDVTFPRPDAGKAIVWNNEGKGLTNSAFTLDDALNRAEGAADRAEDAADRADASADRAEGAAGTLNYSAEDAKKWAIGTLAECPMGSAKYWAEQERQVMLADAYTKVQTAGLLEFKGDDFSVVDPFLKMTGTRNVGMKFIENRPNPGEGPEVTVEAGTYGAILNFKYPCYLHLGYGGEPGDGNPETWWPVGVLYSDVESAVEGSVIPCSRYEDFSGKRYSEFVVVGYAQYSYSTVSNPSHYTGPAINFKQAIPKTDSSKPILSTNIKTYTSTEWGELTSTEKNSIALALIFEED